MDFVIRTKIKRIFTNSSVIYTKQWGQAVEGDVDEDGVETNCELLARLLECFLDQSPR